MRRCERARRPGPPEPRPARDARVADADALHDEQARAGFEPDPATGSRLIEPADTGYGMREFAVVDRSGNLVRAGSPVDGYNGP